MALKKKTNDVKIEQKVFENHIDAQVVFKNRAKSADERAEALEYLIQI